MDDVVNCKVDKVEFNGLEVSCKKITSFMGTYHELLDELNSHSKDLKETIDMNASLAMDSTLQFTKFKQAVEENFGAVQQQIKALRRNFPTISSKFVELGKQQQHWGQELLQSISTFNHERQREWDQQLNLRVSTVDFLDRFKRLETELNCKAWKKDMVAMNTEMSDLKERYQEIAKKAALAIRFINWFSDRGEAYEHNFKVIEKQIGQFDFDKENVRIS